MDWCKTGSQISSLFIENREDLLRLDCQIHKIPQMPEASLSDGQKRDRGVPQQSCYRPQSFFIDPAPGFECHHFSLQTGSWYRSIGSAWAYQGKKMYSKPPVVMTKNEVRKVLRNMADTHLPDGKTSLRMRLKAYGVRTTQGSWCGFWSKPCVCLRSKRRKGPVVNLPRQCEGGVEESYCQGEGSAR